MAKEGTQLNCRPSEILNDGNGAKSRGMDGPEGSCHRLNLRTPDTGMLLDYTFADHKDYTTYRPHRTFYGYRFVSGGAYPVDPVDSCLLDYPTDGDRINNDRQQTSQSVDLKYPMGTTFQLPLGSYRLSAAQLTAGMDRRHAGIC